MKTKAFLFLAIVTLASATAWAQSPCGNWNNGGTGGTGSESPADDPNPSPGDPKPTPTPKPPSKKGDPVLPYTGNEFKRVDDLELWGTPGAWPMVWSRHSNSRVVPSANLFGRAHYWRHSFQWELATTTDDDAGNKRMQLVYPDGGQFVFTENSSGIWQVKGTLTDLLQREGANFTLLRKDGSSLLFEKQTNGSFLMTRIQDAHGNNYTLQYNSSKRLIRVTEPGGQFFSITYRTLPGNQLQTTRLATLATTPAEGEWTQMSVSSETPFRYVRLVQADLSYGQIAEVEFFEAEPEPSPELPAGSMSISAMASSTNFLSSTSFPTWRKLSGRIISSESAAVAQNAFDGNPSTGFISSSQSGGFIGLDLGSPTKIGGVRFRSLLGKESLHRPTAWGQVAVRIEGANSTPISTVVIDSVTTSDGRSVTYEYTDIVDPTLPYVFPALTAVNYSDGTRSTYGHTQVFPGTRPLVSEWNDVRYKLRQGRYRTEYQKDRSTAVLGAVTRQVNIETGQPILTIGLSNNSLHRPMVTYANGGSEIQVYSINLPTGAAITQEIDPNGKITRFTYDSKGFLATKTDPLGRVTSYTWDDQGRPQSQTHPDGETELWSYNEDGFLLTETDPLGHTTTYTRDERNLLTRIDYPDGSFETFTHNAFGQVLTHRQRNGGIATYTYSPTGLMLSETDALGQTTTYTYNAARLPASFTDPLGRTTSMEYNQRGLVTKMTNPDGTFRTYTYTPYGDLASETNELGHTISYTYDIFRRVTAVTDPLGRTSTIEYLANTYHKSPLATTTPGGLRTTFTYDKAWNLLEQTVASGTPHAVTTSIAYNAVNLPVSLTDASGQATAISYDNRDRRIATTDALGHTTSWTYDAVGNVLTETRPDGGVTTQTYDSMNRLTQTTDPKGQTTSMVYTVSGSVASMTDPRGQTYSWQYDLLDRPTRKDYPGGSTEQFGYDAVSNPVSYTTRAGQVRTSVFDSRDREIQTLWSDSTPDITRTFDAAGRVLTENNSLATLTYTYDAAGQLLSETTAQTGQPSRIVAYSYDGDGRIASISYPGGNVVSASFTPRGEVGQIGLDGSPLATYSYTPVSRVASKSLENGVTTAYSYDATHQLVGLSHQRGSTLLAGFAYTLDSVGNRLSKTQSGMLNRTENYSYDAVDQLLSAQYAGAGGARMVSYQYDAVGNRQWRTDSGLTTNYTVNPDNAYTQVGGAAATLDANGNQAGTAGATYTYDAQNRLTSATVGGVTTTFAYDARNRVIRRIVQSGSALTTQFLTYDRWNLIEERDGAGDLNQVYVHGAAIDELLIKFTDSSTVYYHHDGLGSTIALSNETGQIVESYAYDAFGAASVYDASGLSLQVSVFGNRFLFTGREWLTEVGLYDYRNRVYSPDLGRFLQIDPIRFSAGDVNMYRYVSNNSVNRWDPWGLNEEGEKKDDRWPRPPGPGPRPKPGPSDDKGGSTTVVATGNERGGPSRPDGYGDLNFSFGLGPLNGAVGVLFNQNGVAFYAGGGIGTPGPSVTFQAGSGSLPRAGDSFNQFNSTTIMSFSKGKNSDGSRFIEAGAGGPGSISYTENTVLWSTRK